MKTDRQITDWHYWMMIVFVEHELIIYSHTSTCLNTFSQLLTAFMHAVMYYMLSWKTLYRHMQKRKDLPWLPHRVARHGGMWWDCDSHPSRCLLIYSSVMSASHLHHLLDSSERASVSDIPGQGERWQIRATRWQVMHHPIWNNWIY